MSLQVVDKLEAIGSTILRRLPRWRLSSKRAREAAYADMQRQLMAAMTEDKDQLHRRLSAVVGHEFRHYYRKQELLLKLTLALARRIVDA